MPSPYDLSSMTALVCFEAAARNSSFKKAAEELRVTPAAVSHQIKALETDLDCRLFLRHNRGVELTEKGAFLFVASQRGFETISDAVAELRDRPETVDVTIHSTTAVSALWLTPKISAFWKTHPDVTVSQIVSDVPGIPGHCDLSIRYGNPQETDTRYRKLFQDRIVALGTPSLISQYTIRQIDDLRNVPLIHANNDITSWTTWSDWFMALQRPVPKGRGFYVNNYMIALQAAQDDVGAVLGWEGLVGPLIQGQKLVRLVPESIRSPAAFHLKLHSRTTSNALLFANWLVRSS